MLGQEERNHSSLSLAESEKEVGDAKSSFAHLSGNDIKTSRPVLSTRMFDVFMMN